MIKNIVLFLTFGGSLKIWEENGILEREIKIYKKLNEQYGVTTHIISYGDDRDCLIGERFSFLHVHSNFLKIHPRFYSFLIPLLFFKVFLKAEIIKTNQFFGVHIAHRVSRIFAKPLIIRNGFNFLKHIKEEFGLHSKEYDKAKKYEKKFISSGDINIFTTELMANEYKKLYNLNSEKIFVVPNYVVKKDWKPSYKIQKKKNCILFFGRITKQKNLLELSKAIKGLKKKLIIIGFGKEKEKIENFLKKNKIQHNFFNRIPQSKIKNQLKLCDAFILPSLYEGHPKTLIEMMVYKIPIITTNVDGIKEIIKDNVNGILCGTDAQSIRKRIKDFYSMSIQKKKEMTDNAYSYSIKNFEIEEVSKKEYQIYSALYKKNE